MCHFYSNGFPNPCLKPTSHRICSLSVPHIIWPPSKPNQPLPHFLFINCFASFISMKCSILVRLVEFCSQCTSEEEWRENNKGWFRLRIYSMLVSLSANGKSLDGNLQMDRELAFCSLDKFSIIRSYSNFISFQQLIPLPSGRSKAQQIGLISSLMLLLDWFPSVGYCGLKYELRQPYAFPCLSQFECETGINVARAVEAT